MIVASGKATLHELNTVYTLEDAFKIFEIILVTRHNEYVREKELQEKEKLKAKIKWQH